MQNEKRLLRELKRDLKRAGNRQRRRFLKDVEAAPDDFEFGRNRTDIMNAETREKSKQRRQKNNRESPADAAADES